MTQIKPLQRLRKLTLSIDTRSFFILFYLYLWLVIDLRLIYHGGGMPMDFPVFYRGWAFFRETVLYPGGLVEYVSAFLAQFFCIWWAGPLIVTIQALLIWLCCSSILKASSERRLKLVCFVPPIVLLGSYAQYSYPFGVATVFLVALAFVRLYMFLTLKKRPTDIIVFLCLLMILYVIGDEGYLLFAVVCGIYELLFKRRLILGLLFLLASPVVVHIEGVFVFDFGVIHAFDNFMSRSYEDDKDVLIIVYLLYSLLPATLVILWIGELLLKGKGTGRCRQFLLLCGGKAGGKLSPLLGIVAGVVVAYFCYNAGIKAQIAVNYYSCNRMWREVLETSARYPNSTLMNHALNRALYHTGRLPQDMFVYGQSSGGLMLSGETENPYAWWRLFDTYIDLGHMNLAESMLVLSLDAYGERPLFLKRLALINMVKGNSGAARVYLGALSRTLFDSEWARSYLKKIESDPNLSTDEQIQHMRSIMPEIDRDFESVSESIFLDLLDKNKGNRMAFEYLAAYYLLTNRLDNLTGIMGRLNDFNYIRIPRAYEEAILLSRFSGKKVEIGDLAISWESQERFKNFCYVYLHQYGGNKQKAFDKLASYYGYSYLFYALYRRSGLKK